MFDRVLNTLLANFPFYAFALIAILCGNIFFVMLTFLLCYDASLIVKETSLFLLFVVMFFQILARFPGFRFHFCFPSQNGYFIDDEGISQSITKLLFPMKGVIQATLRLLSQRNIFHFL